MITKKEGRPAKSHRAALKQARCEGALRIHQRDPVIHGADAAAELGLALAEVLSGLLLSCNPTNCPYFVTQPLTPLQM